MKTGDSLALEEGWISGTIQEEEPARGEGLRSDDLGS